VASRSTRRRRSVRARETVSGRAGVAGPPAWTVSALMATYCTFASSSLATEAGMG
jgi:hypothetical protein